jgi:serine/threonine protein phosphatase 1
MRLYAIGDIHGQLDMLRAAHVFIAEDRAACGDADAPVVHLGDYIDRGPDSAGVLQVLIDGISAGQPWRCVLGNHDRLFRLWLDDPEAIDPRLRSDFTWLTPQMGGLETLRSYGVDVPDDPDPAALHAGAMRHVPDRHRRFLAGLETHVATDHLFLAHAGVRPGVPLEDQAEDDLIWIRQEFLSDDSDHGKLIVHGHTPAETAEHRGNRVNLDSGAGWGRPLSVAVFEGRDCWLIGPGERVPLRP